ncbi:uncharacterized protein LOC123204694 isoform X1 [Mangifera indica]|uniref:uncharacterized protein LOC123204694 isoform X1 n=1 Tax=Mangifera indica TaxID=29780 RepID=UPI001CFBBE40|nr:uncharacterized protein LOC123204694 isoform X1 [Mangifera indica]
MENNDTVFVVDMIVMRSRLRKSRKRKRSYLNRRKNNQLNNSQPESINQMSALFNFHSFLTVVLLVICTCTYLKMQFPTILEQKTGFRGFFWKAARIETLLKTFSHATLQNEVDISLMEIEIFCMELLPFNMT